MSTASKPSNTSVDVCEKGKCGGIGFAYERGTLVSFEEPKRHLLHAARFKLFGAPVHHVRVVPAPSFLLRTFTGEGKQPDRPNASPAAVGGRSCTRITYILPLTLWSVSNESHKFSGLLQPYFSLFLTSLFSQQTKSLLEVFWDVSGGQNCRVVRFKQTLPAHTFAPRSPLLKQLILI